VVLALALVMTIAAAGAGFAATGQAAAEQRPTSVTAHARTSAADEAPAQDGPSPMVPLVFAGILILAVASPTLPRYSSRYGYYRGERW